MEAPAGARGTPAGACPAAPERGAAAWRAATARSTRGEAPQAVVTRSAIAPAQANVRDAGACRRLIPVSPSRRWPPQQSARRQAWEGWSWATVPLRRRAGRRGEGEYAVRQM